MALSDKIIYNDILISFMAMQTNIHEFKTLSHKLSMKLVTAKEAIDRYQDIQEAGEYIC